MNGTLGGVGNPLETRRPFFDTGMNDIAIALSKLTHTRWRGAGGQQIFAWCLFCIQSGAVG